MQHDPTTALQRLAQRVMERCDILAGCSEERGCITRPFASGAMRRANEALAGWMRAAGMAVRQDSVGNLIGRYEAGRTGAKTLMLGSHLDSVRDAGRYDGSLGVLAALACVEELHAAGRRLPFALEVLAFADEEGLRFRTSYLGSAALAGSFDPASLALVDADGIVMADALRAFGCDPERLAGVRRAPEELLGYCEVHIEQGPVLEAEGLPVGVVTAIAAQSRFALELRGTAGHAGTVPMALRRDALAAAAEVILAAEALARATPGLVATVGQLEALPGASNVIPGRASLSLDVRHQEDAALREGVRALREAAGHIAAARGLELRWEVVQEHAAVPMDQRLTELLERAVARCGHPLRRLPSGAGHDAVELSRITPTAMLFVRCAGGVSHNPAEAVTQEDVAAALDVLAGFVEELAA
jgi:allantoate deiminase